MLNEVDTGKGLRQRRIMVKQNIDKYILRHGRCSDINGFYSQSNVHFRIGAQSVNSYFTFLMLELYYQLVDGKR